MSEAAPDPAAATDVPPPPEIPYAKIGHLPPKIRAELNQRLQNGQTGREILPWLNALPDVIKTGCPINDMNLSRYRNGPYAKWVRQQDRLIHLRDLSRYAADLAQAGGQTLAEGAAQIASGKLLELLETVEEETGKKLDAGSLTAIAAALSSLRITEQNDLKLALEKGKAAQKNRELDRKDEELALAREKFQRDTAAVALRVLGDDRAKAIESGAGSNTEKLELIGQHLFGDLWKPKS